MEDETLRLRADGQERRLQLVEQHSVDCDRRLLSLELGSKTVDGEISSLRATRHDFGNWLNRHNLEINEVKQSLKETLIQRLCSAEEEVEAVKELISKQSEAIATLTSENKLQGWKIGFVLGVFVFIAEQLAGRFHF